MALQMSLLNGSMSGEGGFGMGERHFSSSFASILISSSPHLRAECSREVPPVLNQKLCLFFSTGVS